MRFQPFAQRREKIGAPELVGIGFKVQRVPESGGMCGFQAICGEQRTEFIKSQVVKMRGHGMESGLESDDVLTGEKGLDGPTQPAFQDTEAIFGGVAGDVGIGRELPGVVIAMHGEDAVGMVMDDLHGTSELPAAEALIGCRFPPAGESAITLQGDGETRGDFHIEEVFHPAG